jgi:HSP20 family molecular chaperone IbpA
MTTQFWTADLEVAVNGDELIIKADHLPAIEKQEIEVTLDGGEVTVYGHAPGEEHYLHLPLPAGLAVDNVVAQRARSGGLELHMHLPAS